MADRDRAGKETVETERPRKVYRTTNSCEIAVPLPKLSALAWTSVVLLLLGGVATFGTVFPSTVATYNVNVDAADTLSWTVWIPQPEESMPLTTQGSVAVIGTVVTADGPLLNVTGNGNAHIRYSTARIAFATNGPPSTVHLTGRQGSWPNGTYRVWRQSSDRAANMSIVANLPSSAANLDGSWQCGGSGFFGYPEEGWNSMRVMFGDCVGLVTFPPGTIPATLFVLGTSLAAVASLRRVARS